MLAEEIVYEIEILVRDIDAVLVQQLVYLDEVHLATWFETCDVGELGGGCGTGSSQIARSDNTWFACCDSCKGCQCT